MAAALAVACACAGCSVTVGSGAARAETRQVSGFSIVRLAGQGDVRIVPGSSESLTVRAQENLLPLLTSEVSGGTLTLGTKDGTAITTSEPITYDVAVKDLQGLEISGSGTITAAGLSDTGLNDTGLRVEISGSGSVTVDGSADRQDVDISGSGDYNAAQLASKEATVTISGSGSADLAASSALDVTITGSGSLTYSGNPKVTQSVTGSGSIGRR
ncbi:head GIN domain-containing protein [Terrabacter sp. 2RAF25]|uniref:head GIN domain-containing protein n=1 Tax=Terrabacter sp. 2RAF25 TaxID=3232998 RepID=UPI003F9A08CA